ncbi:calcium-binding protein [Shimia thalassica]|uniref:calcium-binding protein n=1 Tax=Shimia thalassica TaxID=1715693 RepID=UPI0026E1D9D9|nr:hypothetical protein [Shimia thalassica]MDO6481750.1 hypothetical protein [Shimia thalassica]
MYYYIFDTLPTFDNIQGGAGSDVLSIRGIVPVSGNTGEDAVGMNLVLTEGHGIERLLVDRFFTIGGDGDDFVDLSQVPLSEGTSGTFRLFDGDDTMHGSMHDDTIIGDSVDDGNTLDDGDDSLFGAEGNDDLHGGAGNDSLFGEDGDDDLYGGHGADYLSGGVGNDTLRADVSNYSSHFGHSSGPDGLNDTLDGGAGDDLLYSGQYAQLDEYVGAEVYLGGEGEDTLSVGGLRGDLILDSGASIEVLIGRIYGLESGISVDLSGLSATGQEQDFHPIGEGLAPFVAGDASIASLTTERQNTHSVLGAGADIMTGSMFNDQVVAGAGNDVVAGGAGTDVLEGREGDDSLDGQDGDDFLIGDQGNDTLIGGEGNDPDHLRAAAGDRDVLRGGEGIDTVHTNLQLFGGTDYRTISSLILDEAASIEFLEIGHTDVRATEGDDVFFLSDHVSISHRNPSDPTDTFRVQLLGGNDRFEIGDVGATGITDQQIHGGDGDDLIDFTGEGLSGLTGAYRTYIHGEAGNDTLRGTATADSLSGGEGNDVIEAEAGDDSIDAGSGADTVFGGGGYDTIRSQAGSGESVELDGGDGDDTFFASVLDDATIRGGVGHDRLFFDNFFGSLIFDETTSIEYLNIDASSLGGSGDDYLDVANVAEIDTRRPLDLPTYGNWDASFRFGSGNDTLIGSQFSEIISGGEGDDSLDAGAGDDLFLAYQGRDTLLGGAGVDTVILESRPESSGGGAVDTSEIFLNATTSVERIDFNAQAFFGAAADELFDFGGVTNYISYVSMDLGGGADTFVGGAGNDVLTAGGNSRFLDGGDGTDRLTADFSAISNDIVMTHGAPVTATDYSLAFSGAPDIRNFEQAFITLGSGNDHFVVNGNAELSDNIIGGAGDDTIGAGSGDATLDGGDGTDLLVLDFSGLGYNRYNETNTDAGRVRMLRDESSRSESNAATTLSELSFIIADNRVSNFGESGADREDHIHVVNFEQANIIGSLFDDILTGGELDDTLIGGAGDDILRGGGGGVDSIDGGSGNDQIWAAQFGTLSGGEGHDFLSLDLSWAAQVTAADATGAVDVAGSSPTQFSGFEHFQVTLGAGDDLFAASQNAEIADTIIGGAGNDTILGGTGDDSLDGGDGTDLLVLDFSGLGYNRYNETNTDAGRVRMLRDESSRSETNAATTLSELSFIIADNRVSNFGESGADREDHIHVINFEQANIIGSLFDDILTGGELDDTLIGGAGNDSLRGNAGTDQMEGGTGNDTLLAGSGDDSLRGGAGNDSLVGGEGRDTAYFGISSLDAVVSVVDGGLQIISSLGTDFVDASVEMISFSDGALSFGETIGLSDLLLNGTAGPDTLVGAGGNDTLLGEDGWDVLRGHDGDDSLRGGDGNDTLVGGDGDDILIGGESAEDRRDVIYGGAGNDSIDGGYGNDELRGDAGNDTIAGGFGADTVIGGAGDDTLTGAAFGDQIFGGDGGDFINGGFGYDLMNGGAGADRFFHLGIADHGSDWVQDYNAAEGDVLHFGNGAATRNQFQINTTHTATAAGERSGDDNIEEAFVIYRPTGQIMWALVDGAGRSAINLQIGQDVFNLQA